MNDRIHKIIGRIESDKRNLSETFIFNEGWLLRIILDWFQQNPGCTHELSFCNQQLNWYSEALLPTPFSAIHRGDCLSESWTHADGVVGKFSIGAKHFGDLSLNINCDFFYVVEAKIYSELSRGTKNAISHNQAARNVACIIELIKRGGLNYRDFKKLGFYLIVPSEQINPNTNFIEFIDKGHIKQTIQTRINEYSKERKSSYEKVKDFTWLIQNLNDIINFMEIKLLDWESIIDFIADSDISNFYKKCLSCNKNLKT